MRAPASQWRTSFTLAFCLSCPLPPWQWNPLEGARPDATQAQRGAAVLTRTASHPAARRLTLRVGARYTRESSRTLRLYFEEARIGGLRISELTESLLAPALLPRNFLQMRLLQWLRDAEVTFPLRAGGGGASGRVASAGTYILTFMDNSMLIGRAANSGGVFIFSRAPSSSALQPSSF